MRRGLKCGVATIGGLLCVSAVAAGQAVAGESEAAGAAGPVLPGPPIVRGLPPMPSPEIRDALLSSRLSRGEAEAGVPRESVDYYARAFRVNEQVARHRLANQAMMPNAGLVLGEKLGSAYADSWWDNDTGDLVVMATPAASEATIVAALEEHDFTRADFRIERTDYNQAELADAHLDASRRLSSVVGGRATVGVAAGRVLVTLASSVDAGKRSEIREENERLGARDGVPPVETVVSARMSLDPQPRFNCNPTNRNCGEIIAGSKFTNNGVGYCTMAYFVGWIGRSPWVPSALTAGHCLNKEPLVATQSKCRANGSCGPIGLSLQYFYGLGRGDAGMIDIYASGWSIFGGWWNWGPGYQTVIQGLVWDPPGVGYIVCKNGATSGSSCGEVTERWVDFNTGSRLSGMIRTNVWGCYGDSGSPLTSASVPYAVGILSGGAPDPNGGDCAAIAEYYTAIWQPIYYFNLEYYAGGPYAL